MSLHESTKDLIEKKLYEAFKPAVLKVEDESAAHRGHREALAHPQAGHFLVEMVSEAFVGKNAIERHRMVYAQLSTLMDSHIHALRLNLKSTEDIL